jgi:TfoX/Sxy family transcriptional regulator of competence genes
MINSFSRVLDERFSYLATLGQVKLRILFVNNPLFNVERIFQFNEYGHICLVHARDCSRGAQHLASYS